MSLSLNKNNDGPLWVTSFDAGGTPYYWRRDDPRGSRTYRCPQFEQESVAVASSERVFQKASRAEESERVRVEVKPPCTAEGSFDGVDVEAEGFAARARR